MGFTAGEALYTIPPSQPLLLLRGGGNKEVIYMASVSKPLGLL